MNCIKHPVNNIVVEEIQVYIVPNSNADPTCFCSSRDCNSNPVASRNSIVMYYCGNTIEFMVYFPMYADSATSSLPVYLLAVIFT